MIEIRHCHKRFGDVDAVSDLSLTVEAGQWFLFVGPNGAGKTTTFRMLAGLHPPTSGTVRIMGHDVTRQNTKIRQSIGFLPEKAFLYPYLSGREFLLFCADMYGLHRKPARTRIEELLELISFTDEAEELVATYSAGMRKKLGLCSVLLHDPPVLLLDEPTSDLDPRTSNLVRHLLVELADRGKTIFMSTHIFGITEQVCDAIGIIDHGKLIFSGSAAELERRFPGKTFEDVFLELTGRHDERRLESFLHRTDGEGDQ